jgi:carbonic anhydrase/acetyltransferase-like protein (isoleucine patch superfamily)
MGDVEIGAGSSVWPGAVVRGDQASVRIGENSCIQDSVVIHAHNEENPAIIGNNVIIATATALHGVYVGDNVFIQEGCVIFDGATLGEGVSLAPGSIVPPNIVIPPRTVNSGAPAAQIREVSREDVEKHSLKTEAITQVFLKLRRWL